jgi:hypothetical protein
MKRRRPAFDHGSEAESVGRWVGRLEPGPAQELAPAWLAEGMTKGNDHVAAVDNCEGPSGDLLTVVWLEI